MMALRLCGFLEALVAALLTGFAFGGEMRFETADPGPGLCPVSAAVIAKPARGDIECADFCSASDACKSWSFASGAGGCLMTDRDNCSLAAGSATFRRRVQQLTGPMASCQSSIVGQMSTGSTVLFLQRFNGSVNFSMPWADYEAGFGSCGGEFWLGLRYIRTLLGSGTAAWRVEIKTWSGLNLFVEHSGFTVGDASTNYTMSFAALVNKSTEITDDVLVSNNNTAFSTMDRDNDKIADRDCVALNGGGGGFWLSQCGSVYPTAGYASGETTDAAYTRWAVGPPIYYVTPKEIRMYLKR